MVINLMRKIVASNVINQPTNAVVNLNIITKIHKYRGFHDEHHFIMMAVEVHGALGWDMDHFIREYAHLFQDRCLGNHLSLSFCIHFFRQHVSVVFQHALASTIKKKITLTSDAYSRPPITIRSHDLHVGDIKGAVGEIASYHKKD